MITTCCIRALWLVEFINFYQLLGVTHFTFYNHRYFLYRYFSTIFLSHTSFSWYFYQPRPWCWHRPHPLSKPECQARLPTRHTKSEKCPHHSTMQTKSEKVPLLWKTQAVTYPQCCVSHHWLSAPLPMLPVSKPSIFSYLVILTGRCAGRGGGWVCGCCPGRCQWRVRWKSGMNQNFEEKNKSLHLFC